MTLQKIKEHNEWQAKQNPKCLYCSKGWAERMVEEGLWRYFKSHYQIFRVGK